MTRFAGVRLGSAVTKVLVCGKCGQSPPLPCPPPSPPLPRLPPACQIWPKLQPAEARECSAALAISEWTRRLSAMLIIARRKMLF